LRLNPPGYAAQEFRLSRQTYVRTIKYVADVLEEDPELLQAIVSNDDNLSYGNIITVYTGDDESVTALTDDGMEELEQMLSHARRSADEWYDFLDTFRRRQGTRCLHQSKISAVAIGRLRPKGCPLAFGLEDQELLPRKRQRSSNSAVL
jgi:hypothetical protein